MKRNFHWIAIGLLLFALILRFFAYNGAETGSATLPDPDSAPPVQAGQPPAPTPQGEPVPLPILPEEVGGMPLVNFYSGEAAMRDIVRLHNNDFPLAEGVIARYDDGSQEATVWISVSPDTEEAAWLMELMVTKMPQSPVFTEKENFPIADTTIYYVTGMGMDHYYWLDDVYVYWLAVASGTDRSVLNPFIGN